MGFNNIKHKIEPILYNSPLEKVKGSILYFHGGGFIFGINNDLPLYHIDKITKAGYNILSFNYPLAPESDFSEIIKYTVDTINLYASKVNTPYFLWGRSAGAYLCLLAVSKGLNIVPNGIISYYGYGLLVPKWYSSHSDYYLKYPLVEYKFVKALIGTEAILSAPINPRFLLYLYNRQTGNWLKTLSNITEESFLDKFSLRDADFSKFPPVLLAHNTRDNDVPYEESLTIYNKLKDSALIAFTTDDHDFDKKTDSINTLKLIKETIQFLNENI